jgi:uncharacterized protein YraI
MTTLPQNRNIMQALAWFIAACVIAAALLGCSPYATDQLDSSTPTPAPSVTATVSHSSLENDTPTPRPACTVTAYTLNFRAGPGTQHAVKDVLSNGERLQVIQRGAWLKVETAQRVTGWVYGRYCR